MTKDPGRKGSFGYYRREVHERKPRNTSCGKVLLTQQGKLVK